MSLLFHKRNQKGRNLFYLITQKDCNKYELHNKSSADKAQMRSSSVQLLQLEQYYLQQQNSFQKRTLQFNVQLQSLLHIKVIIVQPILTSLKSMLNYCKRSYDKRLDSSEEAKAKEAQTAEL